MDRKRVTLYDTDLCAVEDFKIIVPKFAIEFFTEAIKQFNLQNQSKYGNIPCLRIRPIPADEYFKYVKQIQDEQNMKEELERLKKVEKEHKALVNSLNTLKEVLK